MSDPTNAELTGEFENIWAILERRHESPILLVVTSATPYEDTEQIARGLSAAAHGAGLRTAYLARGTGLQQLAQSDQRYDELCLLVSRRALDSALLEWRATYEVIVAELPGLPSVPLGAHLARVADGALVVVAEDRRIVPQDLQLRTLLDKVGTQILGVVSTRIRQASRAESPKGRIAARTRLAGLPQE